MFGKVSKPFWDDKPVAVVSGGPSLADFDFERLRGAHVLAVKDMILSIPWADAGFGLGDWLDELSDVQSRIYWAIRDDQQEPPSARNLTLLRQVPGQLSDNPRFTHHQRIRAMQICIHKRAKISCCSADYTSTEMWRPMLYAPYFTKHDHCCERLPNSSIRCFQKVALHDK